MKIVSGLVFLGLLASCGNNSNNAFLRKAPKQCSVSKVNGVTTVSCPDGTSSIINDGTDGKDGAAGQDGINGTNGSDAVVLYQTVVGKNQCVEVYPGIYVESINNSEFFDVYENDSCKDSLGEYCDNVKASYGSSGQFGSDKKGSGEVCSIDKIQITGQRDTDTNDLTVNVFDFN